MIDPDPAVYRSRSEKPRNALIQLGGGPRADYDERSSNSRRLRLRDYLLLRPYGRELLTPAAAAWINSAWVIILLMASLEGFVWGAIGFSLAPAATPWLGPPIGLFLFALMFAVIWIVDASLIMSEKPHQRGHGRRRSAPLMRWLLGLLVRVAIVAISLYVTAPFVEKLIRADDIEAWHQAQIERYFEQRAQRVREQVSARLGQLETGLQARITGLERQIEGIEEALSDARQRRARIQAEYQPEIKVLTQDLAAARQRMGDEVLGRDGRPSGYGPEARKWNARAELLEETLESKRGALAERVAPIAARITALQQQLQALNADLTAVRSEQQGLRARIRAKIEAEQPPPAPPELTFAARSKALDALRERAAEQGVPHFETVEGFAQAALGILFFALLALKLFEPAAVQAYFSESIRTQYRHYRAGGLAEIPGFEHHDPAHQLSPAEFARRWEQWERDPEAFVEAHRQTLEAMTHLDRLDAERKHERELLSRRRETIDHQLELEHRQRESELSVHEQELQHRLEQFQQRLDSDTCLQQARDAWALEREHLEQREANAAVWHERREQRIEAQQLRLQQQREARAKHRAEQLERAQKLAETRQAREATAQQIQIIQARLDAQQPALRTLHNELEEAEQQRADRGAGGWFSAPVRRVRHLRRCIRRLEKSLAPLHKTLAAQHARLSELATQQERLEHGLADLDAAAEALEQRYAYERAALEQLLSQPPAAPPVTAPAANTSAAGFTST
jgi:hypothetical protein